MFKTNVMIGTATATTNAVIRKYASMSASDTPIDVAQAKNPLQLICAKLYFILN